MVTVSKLCAKGERIAATVRRDLEKGFQAIDRAHETMESLERRRMSIPTHREVHQLECASILQFKKPQR